MRTIRNLSVILFSLALATALCFGEDAMPPKFYKLDFVVKEVEGNRTLNTRSYSATVSTQQPVGSPDSSQIRAFSKVALPFGTTTSNYDIGVSIDCRNVKETAAGLALRIDAAISSIPQDPASGIQYSPTSGPPTVRDNRWGSNVLVPIKKPTVIFSSDDVTSKHQMQLELTATPIT